MKGNKTIYLLLLCSLVVLSGSGCATIISGSEQIIPVTSTPSGATVTADGDTTITTPGEFTLERKKTHTLVAEYPRRGKQEVQLEKKLNNWVWGNILIGGIIGLVIDVVSGAIDELHPKEVHFDFEGGSNESAANISILNQEAMIRRCNAYGLSKIYKKAA